MWVTVLEIPRNASSRNAGSSKCTGRFRSIRLSVEAVFFRSCTKNADIVWNASSSRACASFWESWTLSRLAATCPAMHFNRSKSWGANGTPLTRSPSVINPNTSPPSINGTHTRPPPLWNSSG